MKAHSNLIQGTPAWHEFRVKHFGASEAPAMLGESPYKTRNELLKEKATGIVKEVDVSAQKRFDDGHRFEALARPLAEEFIGEELYPVTGSEGDLSASFDGLTMLGDIAWEHKTLNDSLRNCRDASSELPLMYQIQMEQQLLVSGAEKVLFTASKFNDDGALAEPQLNTWYVSNEALAAKIINGWAQFKDDLENYKPETPQAEVVAAAQAELPTVYATVNGQLTVQSNLDKFGSALNDFISRLPKEPETDQEFADTEAACKVLKQAEEKLTAAEDNALASLSNVEELRRTVADLKNIARTTRLASEKLVKQRKEAIRAEIVTTAISQYKAFVAEQTKDLDVALSLGYPDFGGAIKGLKTLSSIRDRVATTMANAKIDATEYIADIRTKLDWFNSEVTAEYKGLFRDLHSLVEMALNNFKSAVTGRVEEHKRIEVERLERERARIEEEAKIKAAELHARQAEAERQERIKAEQEQSRLAKAEAQNKADQQVEVAQETKAATPLHGAHGSIAYNADGTKHVPEVPDDDDSGARPTDAMIIHALAKHFQVSEKRVITWLKEMDFTLAELPF